MQTKTIIQSSRSRQAENNRQVYLASSITCIYLCGGKSHLAELLANKFAMANHK